MSYFSFTNHSFSKLFLGPVTEFENFQLELEEEELAENIEQGEKLNKYLQKFIF